MFIYSVRASTLRFFGILAVTVSVLIGIMAFSGADSVSAMSDGAYHFTDISTKEDRLEFLSQFGICVKADSEAEESFTLPQQLDRVLLSYNEKKVQRYTYTVENYKDPQVCVFANVIVYRHRVIGGDISASGEGGFVLPFTAFEAIKN